MKTHEIVYEGTWEEINRHADEFMRRRVRVTVLPEAKRQKVKAALLEMKRGRVRTTALTSPRRQRVPKLDAEIKDNAMKEFLNEFRGAWVGDDFEECLKSVYETRLCTHPRSQGLCDGIMVAF